MRELATQHIQRHQAHAASGDREVHVSRGFELILRPALHCALTFGLRLPSRAGGDAGRKLAV
jgi:hypothetical protein